MTRASDKQNWDEFCALLGEIETISDRTQVAKLSQDYYHFSPILQPLLQDKTGDIVVLPRSESEVLKVVKLCVDSQIPLTVRGAGTGNYGQCVPLKGGVILDMSKMNNIVWMKPGLACVEPGVKLAALDKTTREIGWEMRMFPSTYRTATIGGFIGGGSGGIGSINYGQLRDNGNLHAVRVVTLEAEPRIIELRGDAVQNINHAYGTNGIITQLEIPLAPVYPWMELIVTFKEFMNAAKFGQALSQSDGIIKKLVSICAAPIPSYFIPFRDIIPSGEQAALLMVAETSLEPLQELIKNFQGKICYQKSTQETVKGTTIIEFTWNHTTLHARSIDPSLTYLQTLFPADPELKLIQECYDYFGDEVIQHLEFLRSGGNLHPAGLQIVRFTNEARLNEIIQYHEDRGAIIFNPHTYILEDGGMKTVDLQQLNFKQKYDPLGLLNPGKMRGWVDNG
ncbi:MAG: FAD-binding oxidoreductase [Arthrospira sp. SH-MAG29]|nr:FAD-binding oxidoreductase [Arthrospira sp. SH-MAG29]MBS0014914.1 FAD-binding oxidoreductase [Arthrospira sp. SH-MAG29]